LPTHKVAGITMSRKSCRLRAAEIGPATSRVVDLLLDHRPEDRLRTAGRLLKLSESFSPQRLEAACSRALRFDEPTYTLYIATNPEFDTPWLRFGYSSLTTPNSTYDYNMVTKERKLLKREEVVGDFDPANYQSEWLWAEARDGVKVPISLVYRKDLRKDGPQPLLLYGYGSYGFSTNPYFSSVRLSLLDRGFIYAIAHVRGGQELGRMTSAYFTGNPPGPGE